MLRDITYTAFKWADDNVVTFDDSKSELIHFKTTYKMTKEPKSDHGRPSEKPQPRPQERPRPEQDGWSRKGSDDTRTTDWNRPPRKDNDE